MKIVINNDFGGFGCGMSEENRDWTRQFESDRTNSELVQFVQENPDDCGDLAIVTIPDEATDWELNEYDGYESIIYVLNGKICHADTDVEEDEED